VRYPDLLVPIAAFAAQHGVSRSTVYRLLASGDLKARKLGRRTLVDVQHSQTWLQSLPAANIRQKTTRKQNIEVHAT